MPSKVKDIPDCAKIIQNEVVFLKAWSDVNSLVFNGTKTKTTILLNKTGELISSSRQRR